jgi:hypothetical protein
VEENKQKVFREFNPEARKTNVNRRAETSQMKIERVKQTKHKIDAELLQHRLNVVNKREIQEEEVNNPITCDAVM